MPNVKIRDLAIYHPENSVSNQYYADFFEKKGRNITGLLTALGRKERFVINDDNENTITMGIEAARRVMEKSKLSGKDIDMVVFATQVPEMNMPSNAMYVHRAIGGKENSIVMDTNTNCAGLTIAVEQASRYMLSNQKIQRALIVGSDNLTLVANPDEEVTYASFGDAAAAVILEKTEEDTGFIDARFSVDSNQIETILYPENGLAKGIRTNTDRENIRWIPFDPSFVMPTVFNIIDDLLKENGLSPRDVGAYCLSQIAKSNISLIQNHYELPDDKMIFVGDRFGYTGSSSPFLALYEAVESGKVKRGDYVLFWTIGTGHIMIAMLFKY